MNERTPLLVSHEANSSSPRHEPSYILHCKSIWKTWKIPILCYIFVLLVDTAEAMRSTPKTRLFEMILCRRYYAALDPHTDSPRKTQPDILEHLCKVPDVQSAVVTTKLWLKIGESLFALILAIPFGKLSNTRGRKFVLAIGITGQILAENWIVGVCYFDKDFPFRLVYASSIFKSLGGGEMVLSAIVHATLADVVSEEKRAQAFFHMASVTLLSEVIAPPLGSILMEAQGVYAPLIYGFPLQVLSIAVLFMLPRSVDVAKDSNDAQSDIGGIANLPSEQDAKPAGLKTIARKVSRKLMTSWMLVRNNGNVLVVAASFLATFLGKDTLDFLVQYVSKRFSWSLAKANYLVSFRAITNLVLFLFIHPTISKTLTNRHQLPSAKVDLWIARGSSLFGVIGPVLLGLSPTPVLMVLSLILFTLSLGYPHAIQSYGTSLVRPIDITPFYSFLAMVRIAGTLVASPLIAGTFNLGLRIGGAGLGMPFYAAGLLFGIGALGAWSLG